jgi:hypothetical protein
MFFIWERNCGKLWEIGCAEENNNWAALKKFPIISHNFFQNKSHNFFLKLLLG